MPDTEISLQSLIRIFTRRWRWVIGFSALVLILTYLASKVGLQDQYTASVKLLVSKSKVGEKTMPIDYTILELDTYVHLVESRDSLKEAMEAFDLGQPPYEYRLKEFEDCLEVRQLRNTDLLELQVTLPDPDKAEAVANFLAERAIKRNFTLLQQESKQSREMFEDEVQAAHDYLIQSASNLSAFMENAQTTAGEDFITSSQKTLWELKQDRAFNVILRDESKARLEVLSEIVQEIPAVRTLRRTISSEQEMQDLLRQLNPEVPLEDLLRIEMDNESFDLSHFEAQKAWITARADYEGAIAHIATIDAELAHLEAQVRQAERELAVKQRLQDELRIAGVAFEEVAKKDVEARTMITSERQDLTVIEHAVVPDRPSGPNRTALAVSAAVFAFLLALLISLAIDLYAAMETQPADSH